MAGERASSRRAFLGAGAAAAAAGLTAGKPARAGSIERLAVSGGPKAVTFPDGRHGSVTAWPRYGAEEKRVLHEMVDSGRFYEELPLFEKEWREYHAIPFAKAHMNGTSALTSMFFALDLPPGSEILVPSYTFFATILPMRFFGYVPIFVDLDPRTACFDLDDAARKLTPRCRAMIPMHSWGNPCDMEAMLAFGKEKGLIVCEDAAHAHGASIKGKKMGTFGAMAIYSLQASKPLPAVEGGMGMYQDREHYERAAAFGHYEDPPKFPADSPYRRYEGTGFGQKYRMHPFAAAVARRQLKGLDGRNGIVRRQVRALNDRILLLPGLSEPRSPAGAERVYYSSSTVFLDEAKAGFSRAALLKALQAEGVRASIWEYPEQHRYAIYGEAKWWHHPPVIPAAMPGCAQVNRTAVNLPLFHEEVPELVEQYALAFEKVWAHRDEVARA